MDYDTILAKIKEVKKASKKRNFIQSFDCVVNLKDLDLKKPEHKIDEGVVLENTIKTKPLRITAVLEHKIDGAEDVFDKVIYKNDLETYKGDIVKMRTLSNASDKFVVQASIMPLFAQVMGRYLGPLNKMPNPRLGMVITENTPLKQTYDKLQKTVHMQVKKSLVLQFSFGSEKEDDERLATSLKHALDVLEHSLPMQNNNIKSIGIKLSMSEMVNL